ncbi:hypothetical protein Ocin01_13541 [Orchesella cincta]|uniref:Mitochondrial transcription rescue factor 1 C-terminal domain-containing protein n=1 Tax=Orchesella cincta TaxID=48709 RepID=A0A1D2MJG3_ORCCI|nr:hypothetical protein Ocin01_13541 [Orchesella cincta]
MNTSKLWCPSRFPLILRKLSSSSWSSVQPAPNYSRVFRSSSFLIGDGVNHKRPIQFSYKHQQLLRGFQTSVSSFGTAEEDEVSGKGDKTLRVKLSSTRVDALLKAGLGMSRNKIEKAFYDDRIRINGERPKKKSQEVFEGDEVDVVRGVNSLNPENFIDVSRVEIVDIKLDAGGDDDADSDDEDKSKAKIPAVLRRSKLLTVRNYSPPWKGSSSSD